jgi:ubiquinone/menaquinone biosynthesis C-methylase UbiE
MSIGGVTIGHYIMGKMRWFLRKSSVGVEPLAVTMSGARLGERALQVGLDDPAIAAAIAAKTGMTGLATIVVADEAAAASARTAVGESGGLGDVLVVGQLHPLPFADESYDLVVVHTARGLLASLGHDIRQLVLAECRRVLRAGGRVIALESGSATGLRGLLGGTTINGQYESGGGTAAALGAVGFRAVRTLGDRQGYRFIEGLKA